MKIYDFKKGVDENELFYAYSPQSRTNHKFEQEEECIVNREMSEVKSIFDFEHISLLTKKQYGIGTSVSLECDFEAFGAPLLLLTAELATIHDKPSYDRHFEVVAYEEGINVWDIAYLPNAPEEHFIAPKNIASKRFPIANRQRIYIETKILDKALWVRVNGQELTVDIPDLPEKAHVGLTACEGINRFYSLKIEE